MKRSIISLLLILTVLPAAAQNVTITMNGGKKIAGELERVTARSEGEKEPAETSWVTAQQGTAELRFPLAKMKKITFSKSGDISCFKDSRFAPVRKFCAKKATFVITPAQKMPGGKITAIDDRVLFFHIAGRKEPVTVYLHKMTAHSGGREKKVSYGDLTQEVVTIDKKNVRSIVFHIKEKKK